MGDSFTIHDLPRAERPRERLSALGPEALSGQELLALIIGRGIPGQSAVRIAQEVLTTFGNLNAVSRATVEELSRVKGIGLAKAAQIKAAFEARQAAGPGPRRRAVQHKRPVRAGESDP